MPKYNRPKVHMGTYVPSRRQRRSSYTTHNPAAKSARASDMIRRWVHRRRKRRSDAVLRAMRFRHTASNHARRLCCR